MKRRLSFTSRRRAILAKSRAIPSLQVHTAERGLDGTRRNRCFGTDNADNRLNPRYLVQAFELAIDDLFVPRRQETSSVPAESPFRLEVDSAEVHQPKTAVPKDGSGARAIVCRDLSPIAVAPTSRFRQDEPAWINRVRKSVLVGCMALGTILLIGSTPASWRAALSGQSHPVAAPSVGQAKVYPIEKIQVGDRVRGTNPIREQVEDVEPDAATWRKLSFQLRKPNGPPLWVDLLRPIEWIEANGADQGKTIFLNLPEMGAVGDADVTYVGPCPPIMAGSGTVVTGKFIHQADLSNVVGLRLEGESEPTGVTRNHPYWSQDRMGYVEVGELRIGELLDTEFGLRRVVSAERFKYNGLLYNLETTEHVYCVGSLGALAHNSCLFPYHHPILKAFGGFNRGQTLKQMPRAAHDALHSALRTMAKAANFPPLSGRTGSAKKWEAFFRANPGSQVKAIRMAYQAAQQIDASHGTNVAGQVIQNFRNGQYNMVRAFPIRLP